ncbi:MAG TPA: hypothetical protein PLU99_15435 [Phycisphaerae bacterium]|nr:hypothetical protein [Phycisphaerae bacterium]
MKPCVLAILRRPEGLFALTARRRAPFEPPQPYSRETEVPARCPYEEVLLPLAQLSAPRVVNRKLLAAWEALRRVSVLNEEVAANVLGIVACTLPDPLADTALVGPLELDDSPARPRATAAHPRAYRGTIFKPPKPRQPRAHDLTGHLCLHSDEADILARLEPFLPAALGNLEAHWPQEVAATIRAHASGALRAYGQNWSREAAERIPSLPSGLRRYLLYGQRGQSWRQLARVLELWWGLDLEHEADLRLCVALALSRSPGRAGIEWCATALQVAPARLQFMELLLETRAYERQPAPETTAQVLQADQLCSDKVWRHRMYAVFQLARQLLAISEADELVCFNVYPEDVATDVRKLFREYDVRFARKLGLCIHDGGSEKPEYEIRTILSHDFWDDGAWRAGRGKVGRRSGHCRGSDARLAGQ